MGIQTASQALGNEGAAFAFRNKIINGGFDHWQRGTSFSLTTTAYTADRFSLASTSSSSLSRSTDVPTNYRSKYSASVTSDQWGNGFYQLVEDYANYVAGKTFTMSCWVKGSGASIGKTFKMSVGWMSEDTSYKTLTGDWQFISRTITFPSNFRSTNGAGDTLYVHFIRAVDASTLSSGNTVLITQCQFEEGPVATPFEQRPVGLELQLCQRYYFRLSSADANPYFTFGMGYVQNASTMRILLNQRVPLRATPTVLETSALSTFLLANGAGETAPPSSFVFSGVMGPNGVVVELTKTNGFSAGAVASLMAYNTYNAYIGVGAELA